MLLAAGLHNAHAQYASRQAHLRASLYARTVGIKVKLKQLLLSFGSESVSVKKSAVKSSTEWLHDSFASSPLIWGT